MSGERVGASRITQPMTGDESARGRLRATAYWFAPIVVLGVLVVAVVVGPTLYGNLKDRRADRLSGSARAAYSSGEFDSAIADLERAVELRPEDAPAHLLLAQAYEASGDLSHAEDAYRVSIELDADQPQALYNLAVITATQGSASEAIGLLERALRIDRTFVAARLALADLYASKGDNGAARKHYKTVIEAEPYGTDLEAIRRKLKELE